MPEQCGVCGETVPLADAAHVMRNPPDVEGVADDYVCQSCYDEHVAVLFDEPGEGDESPDDGGTAGSADAPDDDGL